MRIAVALAALFAALVAAAPARAQTCFIFVHGRQSDTGTYTSYTTARNYWVNGGSDGVRTVTNNFADRFYVVGYNGSTGYWMSQAAGEVTTEILNATSGGADGGGNRCTGATSYQVVAHSMGDEVMDFILGNSRTTDANYQASYATVRSRITRVISFAGAHRGSQLADAACWSHDSFWCNATGTFFSCDDAVNWLQTDSSHEVRTYANNPGLPVYLFGGWSGGIESGCLYGEDDRVVQYASAFACGAVSSIADVNTGNVCLESAKTESGGWFLNGDQSYENHYDMVNGYAPAERRAIGDGIWTCGSSSCGTGVTVSSSLSTVALVRDIF